MRLPPLKAVHYFEAAARLQSFTKAAQELNVTHSAISHQIKSLEDWLGQALFERRSRQVRLTDVGQRFLGPVRSAFTQLSVAANEATQFSKARPLTVTCLPSVAAKWLVPKLQNFRSRHPELNVHISATGSVEVIGEGDIDIGIRFGRGNWDGLHSELLYANEVFPVCAPGLLDPAKPIRQARDVMQYPLLTDTDWVRSGYDVWRDWLAAAGAGDVDFRSDISLNYSNLQIQAAIDGLGIAIGNQILAGDDLKHGRLIKAFDFTIRQDTGYWVVYGKNALKQPKIKAFRDWLFDEIRGFLEECTTC
jgi:LysR family glycine cleavage system transcriptional activator